MSRRKLKLKTVAALLSAAVLANALVPYVTGHEFFYCVTSYAATSGTVNTDKLNVRSGPGTGYDKVTVLTAGTSVTINSETTGTDGYTWYYVSYSGGSGYVRYDYISINQTYSIQSSDFESYMDRQGFPESYKNGLRGLHESYPNWVFTAQQTGLEWETVLSEESKLGKNLVDTASLSSWKSLQSGAFDWASNYWPGFDGDSWVQASEELIAYYLDPRNFLTDPYIFQFELQQYNSNIQTRDGLLQLIEGTFLDDDAVVPVEGSVIEGGTIIEGSTYTKGTVSSYSSSSSSSSSSGSGPGGSGSSSSGSSGVIIGPGVSISSSSSSDTEVTGPYKIISAIDTLTGVISSYAGAWKHEGEAGSYTWYYLDDYGNRLTNGWYWLDGNNDGISECYYFYGDGTMAASTEVDGYTVDAEGKWTVDGVIQTKETESITSVSSTSTALGPGSTGTAVTGELKKVPYADIIMYAAAESGVSPYVLAATILQEQGNGDSDLISGTNSTYPGYYNYFNTDAYVHDGMTATIAGLKYAYENDWSSIEKSIIGGAVNYGTNYVNQGQDTYYLKKFNVQGDNLYNHQYMTHVLAAASEGSKVSAAYSSTFKQTALEFKIPVYNNMPDTACPLPTGDGNPNNKLSSISVEGYTITPTFNMDTTEYSLIVDGSVSAVTITASVIDSGATVSGTGTVSLGTGLNQISLVVTAANGSQRTYSIGITRKDDGTGVSSTTSSSTENITTSVSTGTVSYQGPSGTTGETAAESIVTTVAETTSGFYDSQVTVEIGQGPG